MVSHTEAVETIYLDKPQVGAIDRSNRPSNLQSLNMPEPQHVRASTRQGLNKTEPRHGRASASADLWHEAGGALSLSARHGPRCFDCTDARYTHHELAEQYR